MTGHVARAYPASDICWDAPKRTTIPGDNFIPTTMLGTGKTTKTLIDGASVWTAAGLIDAAPSDPAHAGVGGGTLSTTYRKEASPFTYSKDVKFEGKGVVRTDDRTQQNHKNCFGFVDDSNVTGQVAAASDYLKKKCTFDTLKGVCKHGRELGSPPNAKPDEAFFLDVLAEDEVTLTSTRKDLDKNAPSDCKDHTVLLSHAAFQYLAKRYGFRTLSVGGFSEEQEPSPKDFAGLIESAKRLGLHFIFFEKQSNPKLAEALAAEIGGETLDLYHIDGGFTIEESSNPNLYEDQMRANLENLRRAMECK